MDSRLKFLHYRYFKKRQGTQERKESEEEERLVSKDIVKKVTKFQEAHWREKLVSIVYRCPYRKPTQVDEERILRRTGEALLRNSAK